MPPTTLLVLLLASLMSLVPSSEALGYCRAGPVQVQGSIVASIEAGSWSYTPLCPGVRGVDDQTNRLARFPAAESEIEVQFSSCDLFYNGAAQLWVDWNRNFEFEEDEALGGTAYPSPWNHSFVLPAPDEDEDLDDPYFARLMLMEQGELPLDPCANFAWGHVIDFRLMYTTDKDPEPEDPEPRKGGNKKKELMVLAGALVGLLVVLPLGILLYRRFYKRPPSEDGLQGQGLLYAYDETYSSAI